MLELLVSSWSVEYEPMSLPKPLETELAAIVRREFAVDLSKEETQDLGEALVAFIYLVEGCIRRSI